MKIIISVFIIILSSSYSLEFIDTVYTFIPGQVQNVGQSTLYYPINIFGPPSIDATREVAEVRPEEILSIGMGGEIIFGNKNIEILDLDGPDFTIFENAFELSFKNSVFAEPAIVSVSQDGINWFTFPYNLDSLTGVAGTKPTNGGSDISNPQVSGGNSFDLRELGLDYARYIKIKDTTQYILDRPNHIFYDPTLSGFDLDAVAFLNYKQINTSVEQIVRNEEIINIIDINGKSVDTISTQMYFIIRKSGTKKFIKLYP